MDKGKIIFKGSFESFQETIHFKQLEDTINK